VLAIILFRVLSRRRFLSAADGDVAFAVVTMHDHGGQVQFFFFLRLWAGSIHRGLVSKGIEGYTFFLEMVNSTGF
jgi:hypothetical protein